jgi:hypothetical protein
MQKYETHHGITLAVQCTGEWSGASIITASRSAE